MTKKNQSKKAGIRAKKAGEKAKARQTEKIRKATLFKKKLATSLENFSSNLGPGGYEYWLLHGMNFILSSYEEGIWQPIFPEVYEGKAITRTDLFARIMDKQFDGKDLTPAGSKAVIWASLKPKEMFALVTRARQFSWAVQKDPLSPGAPEVWGFIHEVMNKFVEKLDDDQKTSDGKINLPADQYGKILPSAVAQTVAMLSGVEDPSVQTS